ncbi:KN motif and ankyrin repeat domain-containing protein 2 isoform X4 [Erythrolamprus reginae]|uniref:KN motif and ankyrin repeat domain-containing protein 2 isoform X4 n=1 Tax=Erythrolamprus reginae TaxID=121349 RepID=UPI00396CC078
MAQVLHMGTTFPGKVNPASTTIFHGKEQDLTYSLETPYGYRLDLDFLKYVDDIEKGHTIKRIPVHRRPRYSSLPRGYGYTGSWWTSTESLCSNVSVDSRHSSYSYCGRSFYPQYANTIHSNFNARVEKTLLDARKKLEDQADLNGETSTASSLGSLHSSVSGSTNSLVGCQSISHQTSYNGSHQGAPGQFTPIGSGLSTPVSPTPGHLQYVREQMAVALKKLHQLEEQVKMIPVLQVKISVLQEEKRQLSVQLKSQKFLGHPGGFGKGKSRGELYIDIPEEEAGVNAEDSSTRSDIKGKLDKKEVKSVGVGRTVEDGEVNVDMGRCDIGVAVKEEELRLPSPELEQQCKAIQTLSTKIAVLETQLKRALQDLQAAHQKLEYQGREKEDKETSTRDEGLIEWEARGEGEQQGDASIQVDAIKVVQVEREVEIAASIATRPQRAQVLESKEPYTSLRPSAGKDSVSEKIQVPVCATYHSNEVMETTFPIHAGAANTATTFHSVKKISIINTEEDGDGKKETRASSTAGIRSIMKKKEEPTEILTSKKSLQFVGVNGGLSLSKELLSACAVLQKYLESLNPQMDGETKAAYTSMLHYWLKLSCHKEADPELISLHLTDFWAISPQLLEFIINMADANGNTALHYTVSHSNFPIVAKLLETGLCHVDQQNKAGYTAIMLTALAASQTESDMETIMQLLKKGNVNAKASQAGQTALMLAVSHGHLEMVRALLASAANVNLQDEDGSTALMCACEHGHAEIVRLLLATPECDVAKSDKDGSTALSITLEAGQNDIAMMLYAHLNFIKAKSLDTLEQLEPENADTIFSDSLYCNPK